jgi:histidinol phosphatase-like PHP family hydrolase
MYDLHIHSIFSDGELIPAEIARRCSVLGYKAVAITDHADSSNLELILSNLVPACEELNRYMDIEIIPGIEITHVPPAMLEGLVKKSRKLGAKIVVVHGESPVEPVQKGTNLAALKIPDVDILAHPGMITVEEAEMARESEIFLELTSRKGHCIANGHVAKTALEAKAGLLVNTDAHSPEDLITEEIAFAVAAGAGLSKKNSEIVISVNPTKLLRNI